MPGTLVLCATPIGNLEDAPRRLASVLAGADRIYAEDTRRSRKLLSHLDVDRPLRSYFAGNEEERATEITELISSGATVALLTDAGTPGISDPGYSAVRAALQAGGIVETVPGPSAVTAALTISGLPAERFVFEGFLPRKGKPRRERLAIIAAEPRTVVLFAAASRLDRDLADLTAVMASHRRIVVVRELTKLHEEVWRGTAGEATAAWSDPSRRRGEFTLVVAGAEIEPVDPAGLIAEVEGLVAAGTSTSDAVRDVAIEHGVSRRRLYEAVVTDRDGA